MKIKYILALVLVALTAAPTAFADGGSTISGTFFGNMFEGSDLNGDGIPGRHGFLKARGSKFVYIEAHVEVALAPPQEGCPTDYTLTPLGTAIFMTYMNSGSISVVIDPGQRLCPDGRPQVFTGTIDWGTKAHDGVSGTAIFTLTDDIPLYQEEASGNPRWVHIQDGKFRLNIKN